MEHYLSTMVSAASEITHSRLRAVHRCVFVARALPCAGLSLQPALRPEPVYVCCPLSTLNRCMFAARSPP